MRKYYEAYDDRYHQVHALNLQWFDDSPSPIVYKTIEKLKVSIKDAILELGCGEGRDAIFLLRNGYTVTATDVSPNAIQYCQSKFPDFEENFRCLDCVDGEFEVSYKFIYAIAVLHMLVDSCDRFAFYRFIYQHLTNDGYALICSMGDGNIQYKTDTAAAFDLQERIHDQTGKALNVAATSCCIVNFTRFSDEIVSSSLDIVEAGLTDTVPGFNQMMYAIVRRHQKGA